MVRRPQPFFFQLLIGVLTSITHISLPLSYSPCEWLLLYNSCPQGNSVDSCATLLNQALLQPFLCVLQKHRLDAFPESFYPLLLRTDTFKQKSVPHWPEGPCRALFFFFIAKAGTRIGVFENRENAAFPARIERLQGKKCGSTCGISRILNAANANSHWERQLL